MSSAKLLEAIAYMADPQYRTDGLAVIKNGYIVAEAYLGTFKQDQQHDSASVAKSFTSALVGIAIDRGLISGVDERLCQYFDQWDCDDADDPRSRITIRHTLTLTTGLEWQEDWTTMNPATNDAIKMIMSRKCLDHMLTRQPVHEPGEVFNYSTGDPMFLSGVITKATGMNALEFAKKNLFQPIGISDVRWDSDSEGYTPTFGMMRLTVRDFAKFGYLYAKKGEWEDKQVVSEEWVNRSTRTDPSVKMRGNYGYLWHVDLPSRLDAQGPSIPADGFMASGVRGQYIVVIPSKDLVIVKVASEQGQGPSVAKFLVMVLNAIEDASDP